MQIFDRSFGVAVAVGACLFCHPAWANYTCEGQVANLGFNLNSGTVTINIGTGQHYLCSLHPAYDAGNASFDAVPPEACAAMYSTFLTAKTSGRAVKFWYQSAGGTAQCQWAAEGHWAVPDPYPYYFEIMD